MTHHPKTFKFHTDPGHGWLEVTRADLAAVGLTANDFSRCSYQRPAGGTTVYFLEEDCDAGVFMNAYRKRYTVELELTSRHTNHDSRIRGYDSIRPVGSNMSALPRASKAFPGWAYRGNSQPFEPSDAAPGL